MTEFVSRTRVKICGITRPEDALAAAAAGADAIGLVFYANSPRAVSIEQAQAIISVLPPFVTRVGLFVDATSEELDAVLDQVELDVVQFHGNETRAQCEAVGKELHHLKVEQRGTLISIDIKANAFLHHMVRNVAGVLMAVGMDKTEPEWARDVLEARDRTIGGVTASPQGLYLVEVDYPAEFELPAAEINLPFLI